jgi:uncharacterized membrane protein
MSKIALQKVICWRIISMIVGTSIVYLYTGNIERSINLIFLLTVALTGVHYIFERSWESFLSRSQ